MRNVVVSEDDWRSRVAVLEVETRHVINTLDDIKECQEQMAASVRRMEDKFIQVGAFKLAIIAFLPILGGVIGAKFNAIAAFLGFK
jgi:hypothetical protein